MCVWCHLSFRMTMPPGRKRAVARSASPRLQDVLGHEFCLTVAELQAITNTGELRKCAVKLGIPIRDRKSVSRSIMSSKAIIIKHYKRKLLAAARDRVQELESITCITTFRTKAVQLGLRVVVELERPKYGSRRLRKYVSKKRIIDEYKRKLASLNLWPSSLCVSSAAAAPARNNCLWRYGFSVRSGPCNNLEEGAIPTDLHSPKRRR